MKKTFIFCLILSALTTMWACKKDHLPLGSPSDYISIYDVRNIYKGNDITLTSDNMFGATMITGVVVSDHSGKNLPTGLLILQDARRSFLRGIAIPLGADAASYVPGDSVTIKVDGGVLKRVDGLLQITNITKDAVTKVSSNRPIPVNRVPTNQILANPDNFECVLSVIVKGGFDPLPLPTDVFKGDKQLNDGFGNLTLHTEANATFANTTLPFSANYTGIVFNTQGGDGKSIPQFRLRTGNDITILSSTIELTPIVITGFMSDVKGGDGNYEYTQLMATRDIDFSQTPYSLIVTNNANASTPTGYPAKGWMTGEMRTYKFNMTTGTAKKGTFFYVGGTGKMINGASSTSMATSNWIRAFDYTKVAGDNNIGTATGGLYANSGNASGVAVFEGVNLPSDPKPIDVIFVATGGSLFTAGPPVLGYKIANTDWYDVKNPITLEDQPYYRAGTNTLSIPYLTADLGYFNMLGGEYNTVLGKWTKARAHNPILLDKTSPVSMIESNGATTLK